MYLIHISTKKEKKKMQVISTKRLTIFNRYRERTFDSNDIQ